MGEETFDNLVDELATIHANDISKFEINSRIITYSDKLLKLKNAKNGILPCMATGLTASRTSSTTRKA